jgi:predicted AlkP superfamily pyrophosphatase or phosphodiesterase
MKPGMFATAVLLALAAAASAQPPASAPPVPSPQAPGRTHPPKLLVVISVDQFSADLFNEYRQYFTGGLGRLSRGIVFPMSYQSHASTETCPGHSTILTGARPARTGIIANDWYDGDAPREDKTVYCAEDETVPGSDSDHYTASDVHLRVPTLGDLMRAANPQARSVAVAGKDRAAMMMGGHNPTARWWWGGRGFIARAGTPETPAVARINRETEARIAAGHAAMPVDGVCATRQRAIQAQGREVGAGAFGRAPGDRAAFRNSPEYDDAIFALAAAVREEMRLGEGPATDILAIGASATDYVGHYFGTQGSEMCLQLMALDRTIGAFLDRLDAAGIDYAVALTADHGGLDIPERAREQAVPEAARADASLRASAVGREIGARLGLPGPVLHGSTFGDIWVDRAIAPADRPRVVAAALAAYRAKPQVLLAVSRAEIEAAPDPSGPPDTWSLMQRLKASYDPERSGDLYVVLKPRVTYLPVATSTSGAIGTHGTVWDYDRRVPILFWRRGLTPFEQPMSVETVDIMPTLAGLIGLPLAPGSVDGRCLDLDAGPGSTCPQ